MCDVAGRGREKLLEHVPSGLLSDLQLPRCWLQKPCLGLSLVWDILPLAAIPIPDVTDVAVAQQGTQAC